MSFYTQKRILPTNGNNILQFIGIFSLLISSFFDANLANYSIKLVLVISQIVHIRILDTVEGKVVQVHKSTGIKIPVFCNGIKIG